MKLIVLGSGTFFVNTHQTASSFLLETEAHQRILIDCGPGTLIRLSQIGLRPEEIDYLLITHFHPDHTSDLFPFFMNIRLQDLLAPGSVSRFPVMFGPEGLDQFLTDYSRLTELRSYENWGKIKVFDYQSEHQLPGLILRPFKVVHQAFGHPSRAYALRFETGNKVITFSGDSAFCQGIIDAATNADIFVCDASLPKGPANQPHGTIHLNTIEIGTICRDVNVKKLMLTHFYPQYQDVSFIDQVKEVYSGEVLNCHDLEVVNF